MQSALHTLREVWRKRRFEEFRASTRREAVEIREEGLAYSEQQMRATRYLFDKASLEERGVLLGAGLSLAAYDKVFNRRTKEEPTVLTSCPFCQRRFVPDWHHMVRNCDFFRAARGHLLAPQDGMARRLGWALQGDGHALAKQTQRVHVGIWDILGP